MTATKMYCRQCSQRVYGGVGRSDMAHLDASEAPQFVTITEAFEKPDADGRRQVALGPVSLVYCGGCGTTLVDVSGKCLGGCDLEDHGPDRFAPEKWRSR